MNKVLIIGGGFGGLAAVNRLRRYLPDLEISLFDKKRTADFLPMLPDVIGRRINPDFLTYKIENISRKWGFKFINEEVMEVDLESQEVSTLNQHLQYDYLIIAAGSETNFYNNDSFKKSAYKLDDAEDAKKIIRQIEENAYRNYLISGGGYTGIEVATNLRLFLEKMKSGGRIIIVERAPMILGPLPEWMKYYAVSNLGKLQVEILVNSAVERIEGDKVYISQGKVFDQAMVIWAAGVKTPGFIQNLKAEKNPQGRLKVDDYLRLNERCFVVGDAAYFQHRDIFLRMAVQFAISQGDCAAANVTNSIQGRQLHKYRPVDLGYIIPMANNRSCGRVLGLNLRGYLPTMLHFLMCLYRSRGFKNKFGIIKGLTGGGGKW